MHPAVKLLYCLFLNKGRIVQDAKVRELRGQFAMTITFENAEKIVKQLLERLAKDQGADLEDIETSVTTTEFCHFVPSSLRRGGVILKQMPNRYEPVKKPISKYRPKIKYSK